MTRRTWFPIALAALSLGGCAGNPSVRNLAEQTGKYAAEHQAATDAFKVRFDRYNGQLSNELVLRDTGTAEVVESTVRQRQGWAIADDRGRETSFASLTAVSADAIVARVSASTPSPAPLDAGNFDAQMTIGIAAASELAKKPNTLDELTAFANFVSGIDDTLTTLKKNAKTSSGTSPSPATAKPAATGN